MNDQVERVTYGPLLISQSEPVPSDLTMEICRCLLDPFLLFSAAIVVLLAFLLFGGKPARQ